MEHRWDKKRIQRLMGGEMEAVEDWLAAYQAVIYTWLYYQAGADETIAADLTGRTFKRAMPALEHYDPNSESMLSWLREQAKAARDEGLAMRQMKAQRPWAWSQLPDRILCGLSQFRNEPLSEDVTNNPYVREMVQAALAEMEGPNRDLMKHRYNRLKTPEQIADETGQTVRDVNDRLYRCRHFFRRVFVQLIQSANPGFAESAFSGNLELLDTNLEKLLSATNMAQPVSPKEQARLREIVLEAAREMAPLRTPRGGHKKIATVIIAVVLLLAVPLVWTLVWYSLPAPEPQPEPAAAVEPEPQPQAAAEPVPADPALEEAIEQEELLRVFELGQAGDVSGLLEILREGTYTSQMAAALFLARLGDESAIGLLEEAQMQWHPDGPADNPFAQAVMQIEERLLAESGAVFTEPNMPETAAVNEAEETAPAETAEAPRTGIFGIVRDLDGEPIANARIRLSENTLYSNRTTANAFDQQTTDREGHFELSVPQAGAYFIDCRSADDGPAISRALWCEPQAACEVDFGGQPAVFGRLISGAEPAGGQVLYLSDTLNPADASFRAESVTAADGEFLFTGVAPGAYFLLSREAADRTVRLDTFEVQAGGIVERQVVMEQAQLVVEVQAAETAPMVVDAVLTYGPDVSGELAQFALELQDDGTYASAMLPAGSYTLIVTCENGMRLQQPVELNADRGLQVTVPDGLALLSGAFTNPSAFVFFLTGSDDRVRFDLAADAAGLYVLDAIPPDLYTLAAVVNGLRLDFMEIDLQNEPEVVLDIDAGELLADYSPVYVAVTDGQGLMLSDAQVWVTGPGEVVTTQSSGRGAFLALMPGEYSLYAALPGYSTAEEVIRVESMPLETKPNPGNTFRLQLGTGRTP